MLPNEFHTIGDIIRAHKGHYFEPGTMRFFNSRVLWQVFPSQDEVYFVTSERFTGSDGRSKPRMYTVRAYNPITDDIRTVPPFNELTRSKALRIARDLALTVNVPSITRA